ncbi:MAG: hypothetical protein HYY26_06555 [Acidobacteria bacterium]|nr:hypothetical protein [Acidobacteriota bacterium]
MKAKVWVPVVIILVAAAFFLGWQMQRLRAPVAEEASESAVNTVPPAATQEAAPAPAYTQPAPRRAAPRRTSAAAEPQTASPAAPVEATTASAPAGAPAQAASEAPRVELRRVLLAEGTKIFFSLNTSLSTKTNREGDPFNGVVNRAVRVGDTLAIPEGSVIRGSVAHLERPGRVKGRGELGLRFDTLELPDGQRYDLSASLSELDEGEKETVTEEGTVKGEGSKKRDAATVGAGAGIGAAIGAIAGGGKGAAIGAGSGAAAGTGLVLLTRGKDVELRRGSELALQLDRPLTLTIR